MIIKLFLFLILMQVFSNSLFPQMHEISFLDLRGIEDSLDNTFLFYRVKDEYFAAGSYSIYKFNTITFEEELLYNDHWFMGGITWDGRSVFDYVFYNQNEEQSLSCGNHYDSYGDNYAFITNVVGSQFKWPTIANITNLEISRQNNNFLFASIKYSNNNYAILNSSDGGYSWDTLSSGNYLLRSISSLNDSLFLSASIQGDLYMSNNGGINYHLVDNNDLIDWKIYLYGNYHPGGQFKFLYDADNLHIYTVATNADLDMYYFLISNDAGENWKIKDSSSTPIPIYIDIDFSQSGVIYKCAGTTIYKSTDYGESFDVYKEIVSPTIIRGIYKKPASDILYVITEYILYEVTSVSVTPILNISEVENEPSDIAPAQFTLFQNYPNPFNPITTIKYQIPELSFVTIKVYDVLGKEVTTLINEEKPAGAYNEEFRIDNLELSSGIYFYQLRAGNFVETKKMMLIK